MNRSVFLLAVVLGALSVAGLYMAPMYLSGGTLALPVKVAGDGPFYIARLKAALEGDAVLACPLNQQLRAPGTFVPRAAELCWARILRPLVGTDTHLAVHITYAVLPAVTFLAFVWSLYALTHWWSLAFLAALWAMVESSVGQWQPLSFSFSFLGSEEALPFFRFANPMLMAPPLVVALGAVVAQLSRKAIVAPRQLASMVLAALGCGAVYYTQVYYWSWLLGALGLFVGLSLLQRDVQAAWRVGTVAFAAMVFGAPAWLHSLRMLGEPAFSEPIQRTGYMVSSWTPQFLLHKSLLLTFLGYQWVCWRERDARWRFLTCGMVAGYLLLNQNLVTGTNNQLAHYYRPLSVFYVFVLVDGIRRVTGRATWEPGVRAAVFSLLLAWVLIRGVAGAWTLSNLISGPDGYTPAAAKFHRTLAAIRDLPEAMKGSVLIDPRLSYIALIEADSPPHVTELMAHCIVSDAELFARWGMLFRAFGVDESGYRSTIQHFAYNPHNLPWWLYGTPSSYRGRRERYLPEDIRARTESSVAEYDSRSFESFAEELRKGSGLPAMVITTPGYQLDERAVRSMFALRLLREIPEEGAAIWKLQLGP